MRLKEFLLAWFWRFLEIGRSYGINTLNLEKWLSEFLGSERISSSSLFLAFAS